MTELCPFVDDVLDEAAALANQLRRQGVPFAICPVMPRSTTLETYRLITAASPKAVMIDYYLNARPGTKCEDLASRLLHRRIPTVVVTKDRNVVDNGPNSVTAGKVIPVYLKHQLINDSSYVAQLVSNLGDRQLCRPNLTKGKGYSSCKRRHSERLCQPRNGVNSAFCLPD